MKHHTTASCVLAVAWGMTLTGCPNGSVVPGIPEQGCDKGPSDLACPVQAVEFDATGSVLVTGALTDDRGYAYALGPLRAGDRIIVDVDTPQSDLNATVAIFDESQRLFRVNDDQDADAGMVDPFIDEVIRHPSNNYFVAIAASPQDPGVLGSYEMRITVQRGGTVPERRRQTILLDFDGGTVTTRDGLVITVGPFDPGNIDPMYADPNANDLCSNTCLFAGDGQCDDGRPGAEFSFCDLGTDCDDCGSELRIEEFIMQTFASNFERFDMVILNTYEHTPPEDGDFSTVLFGGSSDQFSDLDPLTYGLAANAIDPYNRDLTDDAIVFTDSFKPEVFRRPPHPGELGLVIGNVAAHEVGHLLGLVHVRSGVDVLMQFVNPAVFLEDRRFGRGRLEPDVFQMVSPTYEGRKFFLGDQNAEQLLREILGAFPGPVALVAKDLDGDGDVDLATANFASGDVSVVLNDGSGNFSLGGGYLAKGYPRDLAAGDVDGDGEPDLAVVGWGSGVLTLLNDGNATYPTAPVLIETEGNREPIAMADLDGDGDLDLVTVDAALRFVPADAALGGGLVVFRNQGDGTFAEPLTFDPGLDSPSLGSFWSALLVADLDGDGDDDLALTNNESDFVSFMLNRGDGTFARAGTAAVEPGRKSIAAGDFDGDGDLDLAVARRLDFVTNLASTVQLLLNDGDGSFVDAGILTFPDDLNPILIAIQAGDLDGDGDVDFALISEEIVLPGGIVVLFNDYDGDEFSLADLTTFAYLELPQGDEPSDLELADLDGDGDLDLAVSSEGQHGVLILFNPGDGFLEEESFVSIGPN